VNKRQKEYLRKIDTDFGNDPNVNIFPKPITNFQAMEILREYFLGKNWYIIDPVSYDQATVYVVASIIEKYKSKVKEKKYGK